MIIATLVPIAHWFRGNWVALAMAIGLSVARAGSYAADLSPTFAQPLYDQGWQAPLWLAAGLAGLSLSMAILYGWVDRRARIRPSGAAPNPADRMVWSDVLRFDRSYWYVLALCVLFYSAVFPFRSTFSIKFFQHAEGLSLEAAGLMNSHVFLAAVFATPAFGWLSDRIGRRALLLTLGSLLLTASFVILAVGSGKLGLSTVLLGISFSLVPGVLWPAVSYLVEPRHLGAAFGLMTMLQNLGLATSNLAAGWLNDLSHASAANPAGYQPMLWFFATLSLGALVFTALLWFREKGAKGHGLEESRPGVARPAAPIAVP